MRSWPGAQECRCKRPKRIGWYLPQTVRWEAQPATSADARQVSWPVRGIRRGGLQRACQGRLIWYLQLRRGPGGQIISSQWLQNTTQSLSGGGQEEYSIADCKWMDEGNSHVLTQSWIHWHSFGSECEPSILHPHHYWKCCNLLMTIASSVSSAPPSLWWYLGSGRWRGHQTQSQGSSGKCLRSFLCSRPF